MSRNVTLISLPEEILLELFALFPKHLLLRLRCVTRKFAALAIPGAFRSLRLRAYCDEPQRFTQIARSETLRNHVREVTCDTWSGPELDRRMVFDMGDFQTYSDFLDALPCIASLRNLEAFHLRFGTAQEESSVIRKTVLDRVFRYLAESSPEHKSRSYDETSHPLLSPGAGKTQYPPRSHSLIQLKTLTISNLEDGMNTALVKSEAFQIVTNSPSLVDLRLYLAADAKVLTQPSDTKSLGNLDMFDTLPYSWLRPSVARNLRVLSLYCHGPWGWFPKMDFRLIGAGDGMANLKVRSLGTEKLYLDGRSVLFQASTWLGMVLDQSETVVKGSDGRAHHFSNSGYYVRSTTPGSGNGADAFHGTFRWHHLLSHWAQSMANLRAFKMGKGHWDDVPIGAIDPGYYRSGSQEATSQPFQHHGFRYFECPSPGTTGSGIRKYGTGASRDNEDMLKYIYWTGEYTDYDEMWERRDSERKLLTEGQWCSMYGPDERKKLMDEDRDRDREALAIMISAVDARREGLRTSDTT